MRSAEYADFYCLFVAYDLLISCCFHPYCDRKMYLKVYEKLFAK